MDSNQGGQDGSPLNPETPNPNLKDHGPRFAPSVAISH